MPTVLTHSLPADYPCGLRSPECRIVGPVPCRQDTPDGQRGADRIIRLFGASALAIGIPAGALVALLADGIFRPSSGLLYPTISHGPRDRPQVALTFDDGPDRRNDPGRARRARPRSGARATFFVIGRNLERTLRSPSAGRGRPRARQSLVDAFVPAELLHHAPPRGRHRSQRAVDPRDHGPGAAALYRAPVGLKSPALARTAHAQRLSIVAWSLHSRDTFSRDAGAIAARILRGYGQATSC